MNRRSLNLRLSAAAALSVLAALALSGLFLSFLFERHVMRRVDQELSTYITQLVATLEVARDGAPSLRAPLVDPRFDRPLSGLYWRVEAADGRSLASRSLWDQPLALPEAVRNAPAAGPMRFRSSGPDGLPVFGRTRVVFLERDGVDHAFRVTAAVNRSEITDARDAFQREILLTLGVLAAVLLIAARFQIAYGLRPLSQIRQQLNAIRTGSAARLGEDLPAEVAPLAAEVNALLAANEAAVARARDSAADLAHGLKTPLAVLQAESRALLDRRETEAAAEISAQVAQMSERIERHLAVVRMRGASGGAPKRMPVAETLEKIVRAMRTMPGGDAIDWRIDVAPGLTIAFDEQDFVEVFGNLLDNARKWASSRVTIAARRDETGAVATIADDGPGVPPGQIDAILARGGRLDERRTGAGLGLDIAKRLLDAYGATLSIGAAPGGGAVVTVEFRSDAGRAEPGSAA